MQIAGLTDAQHAEYLALVNAEIRPSGPGTTALDDFPLALGRDNLAWMLAATDGQGRLAGGIATLVRTFTTSCGDIAIGAIGSVVTRADCRGQGLSARLQAAATAGWAAAGALIRTGSNREMAAAISANFASITPCLVPPQCRGSATGQDSHTAA